MAIAHDFDEIADRRAQEPELSGEIKQLLTCLRHGPALNDLVGGLHVLDAFRIIHEPWVGRNIVGGKGHAQGKPVVLGHANDGNVAITARVDVVGRNRQAPVTIAGPACGCSGVIVHQPQIRRHRRHHGILHRDLNKPSPPGLFPLIERGHDGAVEVDAADEVHKCRSSFKRRTIGLPRHAHHAGHGLHRQIHRKGIAIWPRKAVTRARRIDEAQASGGKILAINVAGDNATAIKQAEEFGLAAQGIKIVPMSFQNVDIQAIGLKATKGDLIVTSFFEDVSPAARRFSDAFVARRNAIPSQIQAGVYSAVRHYLQAVKDTDSDDGATVMAKMEVTPVSDAYTTNGRIREDQRMVHDLYLVQVKSPSESKGSWDFVKLVATIPPDQAFRPLDRSKCSLVGK
jgi:hypothetical protein